MTSPSQWDDFEQLATGGPSGTLKDLRSRALLSRPDLERAIADYDARELELKQQVSAQYLQAALGPGYTYDHGIRKATFNASVALPIFNRNEGPIAEAVAAPRSRGQARARRAGEDPERDRWRGSRLSVVARIARSDARAACRERIARRTSARRAVRGGFVGSTDASRGRSRAECRTSGGAGCAGSRAAGAGTA